MLFAWRLASIVALASLGGCASNAGRSPLAEWSPSVNFNARQADIILLHHTAMDGFEQALRVLKTRNSQGRVSAHYLIGSDGRIAQLVGEEQRAWHAGTGHWHGLADLNSRSIGIELDNNGQAPFAKPQIDALLRLLLDITQRQGIDPRQVWAHGDIAPGRKADPSRYFPWATLAEAGFGLWPRAQLADPPEGFDAFSALRLMGYDLRNIDAAVRAYRRHFRGDENAQLDSHDQRLLFDLFQQLDER